ncbi:MAG: C39 family peptidase, partial [Victivallaceae bacterium]|nr:C39 family peptidase [Victivallaceae bacterium]
SPNAYIVLKWSYDGSHQNNFIAHYATVYIYKDKQTFNDISRSKVALTNLSDLKSRVKTNKDGDRYLQVPMVDQGKRGYCVAACAERILKYYNVNVDQHILAQAANTSNSGTRITDIEKSMKSVGSKCNFRVKELSEYSPLIGNVNILKFIKKYNRYAKRAGKNEIKIKRVRGYRQLFRMMDEETLVTTKIKYGKNGFKKFKLKVKATIDSGMPVLWVVMLGMVKEPRRPQNMGGHMRLITGYNLKTDEIIYSDSWGKGHDFKKISWGKAWVMTQMAYVFIPKKK